MNHDLPISEWTIDCLKSHLEGLVKANAVGVWRRGEVCSLIREKMGKSAFCKWVEEQGLRASAYRWIGVYDTLKLEDLEGMSATDCYAAVADAKRTAKVLPAERETTKAAVPRLTEKKKPKKEVPHEADPAPQESDMKDEPPFEQGPMLWANDESTKATKEIESDELGKDELDWKSQLVLAMSVFETALDAFPEEEFDSVGGYREGARRLVQQIQCVFRL